MTQQDSSPTIITVTDCCLISFNNSSQQGKHNKILQACKIAKILTTFLILRKKAITNIFNHVNTDWLIISLLNIVIEKKNWSLENRIRRQTSGWVTCAKPSRRNTNPSVSHAFSRRFSKQNHSKYISDVVSKILEKKKHNYQVFCLNLWSSWNWVSCGESWKSLLPIFLIFHRTDFRRFLVCC